MRLAGVTVEVKKKVEGKRDVWCVIAYSDMLAAGHEELRAPSPRSLGRLSRGTLWMRRRLRAG